MHTHPLLRLLSKRRGHFHRLPRWEVGKFGWLEIDRQKGFPRIFPETCSVISARAYLTRKLTQLYSSEMPRRVRKICKMFAANKISIETIYFICAKKSSKNINFAWIFFKGSWGTFSKWSLLPIRFSVYFRVSINTPRNKKVIIAEQIRSYCRYNTGLS